MSDWTVIEGDAFELLPAYADASVDHVITDPPFTDYVSNGARSSRIMGNSFRENMGPGVLPIDFAGIDGKEPWLASELIRITTRWVLAFCAFEQLAFYAHGAGNRWVRPGVWVKTNPTPQLSGDRPAVCGEAIAIMHRNGKKRWNRGGHAALWRYGREQNRVGHPTQKPLDLILDLVMAFTDYGDTVLDPFCGSGTMGVACLRMRRKFIGIECNPKYADLARRRLEAEANNSDVKAADAGQIALFGKDNGT